MTALVISQDRPWTRQLINSLDNEEHEIFYSSLISQELIENIGPDWIFFFHWSEIVPKTIYKNYKCCVIHTGNLPKARGGSPLQNQILEGVTDTQVNIIEMSGEIDAGGVYCSAPISLQGSITDIWLSIADVTSNLINFCMAANPKATPQRGKPQTYKRIKNNSVNFNIEKPLSFVYDQIRMVDDDFYPKCHLDINGFRLEFSRPKLKTDEILADVTITKK